MSLELRYGREDEELMGLQFCNEMIIVTHQIYPLQQPQKVSVTILPSAIHVSGKRYNQTYCITRAINNYLIKVAYTNNTYYNFYYTYIRWFA